MRWRTPREKTMSKLLSAKGIASALPFFRAIDLMVAARMSIPEVADRLFAGDL
jgi:hypothetical protein